MAKKGLLYWMLVATPFTGIGYLFYTNWKKYKDFNPEELIKDPVTQQRRLTDNQIRHMGERSKVKDVPVSDDEKGYM